MMMMMITMAMIVMRIEWHCSLSIVQGAYKAVVEASNQIFNQKLWYIMVSD